MCTRFYICAILAISSAACFTQPVGRGSYSEASQARQKAQAKQAYYDRVEIALRYAAEHPADREANRKAIDLATQAVRSSRVNAETPGTPTVESILAWTEPVQRNLAADEKSCGTNVDVANMLRAADQLERASTLLLDSARRCHYVPALAPLARTLRTLKKCDDLMPLAREIWPGAGTDDQVPVLDAVNLCSNEVNLRSNLSFAPPQVVDDYFGLLAAREEQRRENECVGSCSSAYSSCSQSCWSNRCGCDETYDLCTAMCR